METQTRNHLTFTLLALPLLAALAWYAFSADGDPGATPNELGVHPADHTGANETAPPDSVPRGDHERTLVAVGDDAPDSVGIRGRVLDRHGEPLGNALVGDIAAPQPVATTADGRFQLHVELGTGSTSLLVLAAGHAPYAATYAIDPEAPQDIGDIELQGGGGLRGLIKDGMGKAIPGATATLQVSGNSWPRSVDLMEVLEPAAASADGSYSFAHLMPGQYRVTASAPGMQTLRASSSVQVMENVESVVDPIVLEVGFELTGVVIDDKDAPVADAAVHVRNGQNQARYDGRATTAADGRFQMSSLPPGPLRVEVEKVGFLAYSRSDFDASLGHELVVRLEGGLRVTGVAVDSQSGLPVEEFAASIRRIGRVDPESLGSATQQLQRQIDALRAAAAAATDLEVQAQRSRIATEFEARLERVRRQEQSQPVATPADVGPVENRPLGRFAFDGLEEGLYAVMIASPDHQFAQVEPVEVRRGMPGQDLRVVLTAGRTVRGIVVSKHDGTPIAGAKVELLRPLETSKQRRDLRRSLYPWVFARSGPQGVVVKTTRTGADGAFELRQAAPGRCFLSVRHEKIADHDTEAFYVTDGRQEVRVAVGMRASLTGRVHGIPPGLENGVEVIVLGGHGTMQTTAARADGSYRFEDLQPGSYIVRAFPSDSSNYVNRLFGGIFPLWSGAVDHDNVPQRDVTLAEGEALAFDLALDLPPAGIVQGWVTINGQPQQGGRAILRPVPGEAPGSGGQSLRAYFDDRGQFAIAEVPAGNYVLRLYGRTNQELYDEPLTVDPGATSTVRADLAAGGLRGRVTAPEVVSPADLRGYVWVLPGATDVPADVRAYRNTNRANRVRVRNGLFEDDGLTPGPAILIVDIRGWEQVVTKVAIPAGRTLELDLTTGGRLQ